MTALVQSRAVSLYDPTALPVSFIALEVFVLAAAGLTLAHALRAHRRGDRAALLTWITIVVYGLLMEVVSYHTVDNFAHGRFTVMLYDEQLPLYIVAIYPVMLYTGIATARRLGLPRVAEACAAGVLIVLMDLPFDLAGPVEGWWTWFDGDPNTAYRWHGVPVTSFYWHMTFGGILAALTRAAAARFGAYAAPTPWLALPIAIATIVAGVVGFLPFHALSALGLDQGAIVAGAIAVAVTAAAAGARRADPRFDRMLAAVWLGFYALHVSVALA